MNKKFLSIINEVIKNKNERGIPGRDDNEPILPNIIKTKKDYSMKGEYADIVKQFTDQKTKQMSQVRDLRKERKELNTRIKDITNRDSNTLFDMTKEIERRQASQMQTDFIKLSNEIGNLKSNKTVYQKYLTHILKRFFTVPGSKMSKRYLVLPLSNSFNINQINKMNTGKNVQTTLSNVNQIVVDKTIDEEIKNYLTFNGYHFKNDRKDLYENICYTHNGAPVKISDEFKKISQINITNKRRALEKSKDEETKNLIEKEIKKREDYKEEYLERIELINIVAKVNVKQNIILLTWVPRMIMSQSTETIWRSCMTLEHEDKEGITVGSGSNARYVPTSIENGVFIAWLVDINDVKKVDEPKARILIKPLETENGDIIWWPSAIYTVGGQNSLTKLFEKTLRFFCYKKQLSEFKRIREDINISYTDFDLSSKHYQDLGAGGLYDTNTQTLKEKFSKQQDLKSNQVHKAIDFSEKKLIYFLGKKKEKLSERELEYFLKLSLSNQYVSLFNYLIKIDYFDKETIEDEVVAFLRDSDNDPDNDFYQFIFNKFFHQLDDDRKSYMLEDLLMSKSKTGFIYIIFKDEKNLELLTKRKDFDIERLIVIFANMVNKDEIKNKNLLLMIKTIISYCLKTRTNDFFNFKRPPYNAIYQFFTEIEHNYNELPTFLTDTYQEMLKQIEVNSGEDFYLTYVESTKGNLGNKKINKFFINRFFLYLDKIPNFNKTSFISSVLQYNIYSQESIDQLYKILKEKNILNMQSLQLDEKNMMRELYLIYMFKADEIEAFFNQIKKDIKNKDFNSNIYAKIKNKDTKNIKKIFEQLIYEFTRYIKSNDFIGYNNKVDDLIKILINFIDMTEEKNQIEIINDLINNNLIKMTTLIMLEKKKIKINPISLYIYISTVFYQENNSLKNQTSDSEFMDIVDYMLKMLNMKSIPLLGPSEQNRTYSLLNNTLTPLNTNRQENKTIFLIEKMSKELIEMAYESAKKTTLFSTYFFMKPKLLKLIIEKFNLSIDGTEELIKQSIVNIRDNDFKNKEVVEQVIFLGKDFENVIKMYHFDRRKEEVRYIPTILKIFNTNLQDYYSSNVFVNTLNQIGYNMFLNCILGVNSWNELNIDFFETKIKPLKNLDKNNKSSIFIKILENQIGRNDLANRKDLIDKLISNIDFELTEKTDSTFFFKIYEIFGIISINIDHFIYSDKIMLFIIKMLDSFNLLVERPTAFDRNMFDKLETCLDKILKVKPKYADVYLDQIISHPYFIKLLKERFNIDRIDFKNKEIFLKNERMKSRAEETRFLLGFNIH